MDEMKEFITVYIGGFCTGAPVWFALGFAFSCWCFVKGFIATERASKKKVKWAPPQHLDCRCVDDPSAGGKKVSKWDPPELSPAKRILRDIERIFGIGSSQEYDSASDFMHEIKELLTHYDDWSPEHVRCGSGGSKGGCEDCIREELKKKKAPPKPVPHPVRKLPIT